MERLGDDGGGAAGEVAVREPICAELVGDCGGAAAINVVRNIEGGGERKGVRDEREKGENDEGRHWDWDWMFGHERVRISNSPLLERREKMGGRD